MLAEGSIPMLPLTIAASSDNISPNKLFVKIVSNCKIRPVNSSYSFQSLLLILSINEIFRNWQALAYVQGAYGWGKQTIARDQTKTCFG